LTTGLPNIEVYNLTTDSAGRILAGARGVKVFRSIDNGQKWSPIGAVTADAKFYAITVNRSGHIFVGTDKGVFRSTDNGTTWQATSTGLTNLTVYDLVLGTSGAIFAGTGAGVFHSTDNGSTWTR
jgi:photosystem II stability/assembly factor-like uncharacterized protein